MDTRSKAQELAGRPYIIVASVDQTTNGRPIHFARVLEMDGCFGQGQTREQAIEDLRLAIVDFIASLLEDGLPVPEPTKLVSSTTGTAAQTTLTFVGPGKNLRQKPQGSYRDTFVLSVRG